jgi:antitoxin CptB
MNGAIDAETARRLRWRCRRGLLEVDLILAGFAARELAHLDPADAVRLGELLEHPDPILLEWLLGRDPPPPELASVVRRVRGTDAP